MAYDWTALTNTAIMNLFLYGRMDTPVQYDDRVRNERPTAINIEVDAVTYMSQGPGRYAYELVSQFPIVAMFFGDALRNPDQTGSVTLGLPAISCG